MQNKNKQYSIEKGLLLFTQPKSPYFYGKIRVDGKYITKSFAPISDLEVAKETGLPLFLHQRDAHEDFINCLNEIFNEPIKGVAHCFTGNVEQMKTYLDMGLYIGITGWICDERRNQELIRAVKQLPLNRVLIETDSPYLIPRSLKNSRRNEPMHLPIVAMKLADEMNIEASILVKHARENSMELFGLSG